MDILIAHSNRHAATSLKRMLERRGYHTQTVVRAALVESAIRGGSYTLVLLDWSLGRPDSLVTRLRRSGKLVPVVGLGRPSQEVAALEAGADAFVMQDGLDIRELIARLEALGRRAALPPAPRRVAAGGIELDEVTRTVTIGRRKVVFASSECRVLAHLLSWAGRVVSREEVVTAGWGEGVEVSPNAVHSLMKRLRHKLGRQDDRIRVMRPGGYVFVSGEP